MKHKKIGDLVRNIHTGELHIVTAVETVDMSVYDNISVCYYEVDNQWLIPEEHLEALCK